MTPQEKAKEIVEKMFFCDKSTPDESMAMLYPHAKQCALITVDEMIEFEDRIVNQIREITQLSGREFKDESRFWQQVKHEIEKL